MFLVSGLQHGVTDVAEGIPWSRSGSLQFFLNQFLGVVLEDAVQDLWRRVGGRPGTKGMKVVKMMGFLWVFLFHAWSVPGWIYPCLVATTGEEKDKVVPFSIVKPLLRL